LKPIGREKPTSKLEGNQVTHFVRLDGKPHQTQLKSKMIKNMKTNIGGANDVGIIDHGREH
jgi:hypothetical protein